MDEERHEVYERIPWETLERHRRSGPVMVYTLSAAVVLGVLAYAFFARQPAGYEASVAPVATDQASVAAPAPVPIAPVIPPTSSPAIAEADLYAVDADAIIHQVAAHAEWFATEFLTVDGSEGSARILAALLPEGIPVPVPDPGTSVFVDWARAMSMAQTGPWEYRVEVLVRSLVAEMDQTYVRLPPRLVTVDLRFGEAGPEVTAPPSITALVPAQASPMELTNPPPEIASAAMEMSAGLQVVGGVPLADGRWRVVVMSMAEDGVVRPVTVYVP